VIDLWRPWLRDSFTDTNILDWPHTNKAISSKCNRIDSKTRTRGAGGDENHRSRNVQGAR